jgi:hypothetical protein
MKGECDGCVTTMGKEPMSVWTHPAKQIDLLFGVKVLKMWIALYTWAVQLLKMEELCRMFRNEFEKQMVLSYNSTQCGKTAEYLLGPNSASSTVMLSRCCYVDLRHGE